jgi:amino acid transporter
MSKPLTRGLGLLQATSLNVANMIGIGPFITIPLFLGKMGGPHAMIGWLVAAVLVICDGLVWAELGAALPGSGGSYHFLRETFGRYRLGRIMPFLFIWQFLVTGTLELASGYLGAAGFLTYVLPQLAPTTGTPSYLAALNWLAAGAAIAMTLLACRHVRAIGWLAVTLCTGTIITVLTIILSGVANFDPTLITIPEGAWTLDGRFAAGLAGAMLIAVYDYLGYYNVCHVGEEVRDPGRTIPRAILISIVIVASVYLTMNISLIGVIPWQQAVDPQNIASKNIAAAFVEKIYGSWAAWVITALILWTALAGVFVMTVGYSRIPFAAARNGDFFAVFGRLHSTGNYPLVALLFIGGLTALFCFFPLQLVIDATVTVRIAVVFIGQIAALHLLRKTRPDVPLPFRMWLYPIPSLVALSGWIFLLLWSDPTALYVALAVNGAGIIAFCVWHWTRFR